METKDTKETLTEVTLYCNESKHESMILIDGEPLNGVAGISFPRESVVHFINGANCTFNHNCMIHKQTFRLGAVETEALKMISRNCMGGV